MMFGNDGQAQQASRAIGPRIYRVCLFEPGAVVPKVQLMSATNDEQAITLASTLEPSAEREVWERHRLVAEIPAIRRPVMELTVRA
ncbi:MAG: hypothetical protein ACJ8E4_03985 [Sphingomicrobium sp.]